MKLYDESFRLALGMHIRSFNNYCILRFAKAKVESLSDKGILLSIN